ncbi:MAG: RluA family pseudouridine synthase [Desulfonauticus sp.]|nr:RluA family pseudouridine synthase [Desulfonauticus sp.]
MRLDVFCARYFGLSRRQAKAFIQKGKVLVNGRVIFKGSYVLGDEDKVNLLTKKQSGKFGDFQIKILKQSNLFAAISKPANFHSVTGWDNQNVENYLPFIFPGREVFLLNRLDFLTSGILLVALAPEGQFKYKSYQEQGKTEKFYLAKIRGQLAKPVVIDYTIDDARRKKVKVLKERESNFLRFTWVYPLCWDKDCTLVKVKILKGKRHQIRAHLSFVGYPIVGDVLYGAEEKQNSFLFLHHYCLKFPGFRVVDYPAWF